MSLHSPEFIEQKLRSKIDIHRSVRDSILPQKKYTSISFNIFEKINSSQYMMMRGQFCLSRLEQYASNISGTGDSSYYRFGAEIRETNNSAFNQFNDFSSNFFIFSSF